MPRLSAPRGGAGRCSAHLASLAVAVVLAQHALLLGQRIADGSLLDPTVLARWTVGVLLTGGMLALRGSGPSLVRGRHAGAFWLAVLVFHVAAVAAPADSRAPATAALLPGPSVPVLLVLATLLVGAAVSISLAAPRGARGALRQCVQPALDEPVRFPLLARPPPPAVA